jgi:hypothetical protein
MYEWLTRPPLSSNHSQDIIFVTIFCNSSARVKIGANLIYLIMKVSQLCTMIQDSIRSGRYPLETEAQKRLAGLLQVVNKSESDELDAPDIQIETRIKELYILNNYVPNIEHLPGIIEQDVLDSFKMICRRVDRIKSGIQLDRR